MAGRGQIQIGLALTADTSQAKRQLQDLKNTLNNLTSVNSLKFLDERKGGLNKELRASVASANELKAALENSTNVDTGRLNLTNLSRELQRNGKTITDYSKDLAKLGPMGEEVFTKLAASVIQAEVPIKRTNKVLDDFSKTLYKVTKWQISQAIFRNISGSINDAYSYAQELNKSLNSIRIVTNKSTDDMAKFAEQANKVAQALSTATTEYTDASLIFYQQGLNDSEVAARTESVIKLANVTGDSAQQVSNYMTAIWNNYAEAGDNLDSYADKITALGAATASSSQEIAQGLNSFVAIGKTVGLSYDYATTALATVTAQTRQSASVVGNSFRTIFARLQGLSQNETQEDGTDLNKYSKALAAIGVNIKTASGGLKEMDQILDETAAKWSILGKAQQNALAQTIGGTRQYANVIALFDNWGQFQENLKVTQGAEGTLQEQADIYAESWEAAQKRVKASAQAIYQDLLKDDFFIGLTNGLDTVLKETDKFIDSIGGLKGVLLGVSAIVVNLFHNQISQGLDNIGNNIKVITGLARVETDKMRDEVVESLGEILQANREAGESDLSVSSYSAKLQIQEDILTQSRELQKVADILTEEQFKEYQQLIKNIETYGEYRINATAAFGEARQALEDYVATLQDADLKKELYEINTIYAGEKNNIDKERFLTAFEVDFDDTNIDSKFEETLKTFFAQDELSTKIIDNYIQKVNDLNGRYELLSSSQDNYNKVLEQSVTSAQEMTQNDVSLSGSLTTLLSSLTSIGFSISSLNRMVNTLGDDSASVGDKISSLIFGLSTGLPGILKGASGFTNIIKDLSTIKKLTGEGLKTNALALLANGKSKDFDNIKNVFDAGKKKFEDKTALQTILDQLGNGEINDNAAMYAIEDATNALNESSSAFDEAYGNLNLFQKGILNLSGAKGLPGLTSVFSEAGTALVGFVGPLMPAIATIAAITAGIWALKKGLEAIHEASPEGQLEKAKEELKILNDNLESYKKVAREATEQSEAFSSALDGWKDKKDNINALTKGTTEYKNAISQANTETLNMLKNAGLLGKVDISKLRDETNGGLIDLDKMNKADKDAYKKSLESKSLSANNTVLAGELASINQANEVAIRQAAVNLGTVWKDVTTITTAGGQDRTGTSRVAQSTEETYNQIKNLAEKFAESGLSDQELTKELIDSEPEKLGFLQKIADKSDILQAVDKAAETIANSGKEDYEEELGRGILETSGIELSNDQVKYEGLIAREIGKRVSEAITNGDWESIELTDEVKSNYAKENGLKYLNNKFYDENDQEVTRNDDVIKEWQMEQNVLDEFKNNTNGKLDKIISTITNDDSYKDKRATAEADYKDAQRKQAEEANVIEAAGQRAEDEAQVADYSKAKKKGLEEYTQYLQENVEALKEDEDMAYRVAAANSAMNDGVSDLIKNFDEYKDALESGDIATEDYQNAVEAIGKVLDIDASGLSREFLQSADNLALMQEAAYGNVDAIEQLREAAAQDILIKTIVDEDSENELVNSLNGFINSQEFADLEVGSSLDDSGFVDGLNAMLETGQMTVDEVQKVLNSLGFEPTIEYEPVSLKEAKASHYQASIQVGDKVVPVTDDMHLEDTATVLIPKINSKKTIYRGSPASSLSRANRNAGNKARNGGSKGGGSGKQKETKDQKEFKDEVDRYHEVKQAIEDNTRALQRYTKEKDRAFGREKLRQMRKEIDAQKESIRLQQQYIKEAEDYLKADAAQAKGYGIQLDSSTGRITNYDEVLQSQINQYNSAVNAYNSSAQSDQDKKNLEAAEKYYNNFKAAMSKYEETLNLYEQLEDELTDKMEELYDMALETAQIKLEWRIGLNEDDVKHLEWQFKHLGDEAEKVGDRISNLSKKADSYLDNISAVEKAMDEIFQAHGYANGAQALLNGELNYDTLQFTDAEIEELRDLADKWRDYYDTLVEVREEIHQNVLDVFNDFNDELDENQNKIDNLVDSIETWKDIVSLMGEEATGMTQGDILVMSQQALENMQKNVVLATLQVEQNEAAVAKQEKMIADLYAIGNEEGAKLAEENLKQMQETLDQAKSDWRKAIDETAKYAKQVYQDTVEYNSSLYDKQFGSNGLSWAKEQLDRQKELNHLYLDDYEKLNGLNKLQNSINKSLNNNPSVKVYGKLNELLDDVNAAQQIGVQLSEYEVTTLENRLKLVQALDAVEQARNAKSAVRMTRDNEGNFSYTYTADQDKINEAENAYSDAFYEMLKFQRDSEEEFSAQLLQIADDYNNAITELYTNWTGTEEELKSKVDELTQFYTDKFDFYKSQLNSTTVEMLRIRDEDWQDAEEKTGYKLALEDDFVTSYEQTSAGYILGLKNMEDAHGLFTEAVSQLLTDNYKAVANWQNENHQTMEEAGIDQDKFKETVDKDLQAIDEEIDKTADKSQDLANAFDTNFNTAMDATWDFESTIGTAMDSIRSQIDATISELDAMIRKLREAQDGAKTMASTAVQAANTAIQAANAAAQAAASAGGSSGNTGNTDSAKGGSKSNKKQGIITYTVTDVSTRKNNTYTVTFGFPSSKYASEEEAKTWIRAGNMGNGEVNGLRVMYYDTGGYTGSWGKEGRLAMLHEKEIVLNKDDTANMLSMVSMVREVVSNFGAQWGALSNTLSRGTNFAFAGSGSMEQNVHIDASFPNVTDHNEIETAMNNLINSASQFANRK